MSTYCLKCKTKTENKDETREKTKNNRMMLKCICAICGRKKSMFLKSGAGLCPDRVILIDD